MIQTLVFADSQVAIVALDQQLKAEMMMRLRMIPTQTVMKSCLSIKPSMTMMAKKNCLQFEIFRLILMTSTTHLSMILLVISTL
jgi:hypothetical protein